MSEHDCHRDSFQRLAVALRPAPEAPRRVHKHLVLRRKRCAVMGAAVTTGCLAAALTGGPLLRTLLNQ